jgi:hypothetical protein
MEYVSIGPIPLLYDRRERLEISMQRRATVWSSPVFGQQGFASLGGGTSPGPLVIPATPMAELLPADEAGKLADAQMQFLVGAGVMDSDTRRFRHVGTTWGTSATAKRRQRGGTVTYEFNGRKLYEDLAPAGSNDVYWLQAISFVTLMHGATAVDQPCLWLHVLEPTDLQPPLEATVHGVYAMGVTEQLDDSGAESEPGLSAAAAAADPHGSSGGCTMGSKRRYGGGGMRRG